MGMAEYIEREKIGLTDFGIAMRNGNYKEAFKMFLEKIDSTPAADVRPVVRGKWVLEYEPNGKPYCFHCSVCDGDFHYIGITTKYDFCPNCGADMREES